MGMTKLFLLLGFSLALVSAGCRGGTPPPEPEKVAEEHPMKPTKATPQKAEVKPAAAAGPKDEKAGGCCNSPGCGQAKGKGCGCGAAMKGCGG